MPVIEANWNEVPEEIPVIPEGEYTAELISADVVNNAKGGVDLNLGFRITEPGDVLGRIVFGRIWRVDTKDGQVGLKRLSKSCGIEPSGTSIDTDDLKGLTCRVLINHRNVNGTLMASIKDFLF